MYSFVCKWWVHMHYNSARKALFFLRPPENDDILYEYIPLHKYLHHLCFVNRIWIFCEVFCVRVNKLSILSPIIWWRGCVFYCPFFTLLMLVYCISYIVRMRLTAKWNLTKQLIYKKKFEWTGKNSKSICFLNVKDSRPS